MLAFVGSSWQWLLILVVVLLLFGNRIPGLARSLGSGITEFKKGLKEGDADKDKQVGGGEPPRSQETKTP